MKSRSLPWKNQIQEINKNQIGSLWQKIISNTLALPNGGICDPKTTYKYSQLISSSHETRLPSQVHAVLTYISFTKWRDLPTQLELSAKPQWTQYPKEATTDTPFKQPNTTLTKKKLNLSLTQKDTKILYTESLQISNSMKIPISKDKLYFQQFKHHLNNKQKSSSQTYQYITTTSSSQTLRCFHHKHLYTNAFALVRDWLAHDNITTFNTHSVNSV